MSKSKERRELQKSAKSSTPYMCKNVTTNGLRECDNGTRSVMQQYLFCGGGDRLRNLVIASAFVILKVTGVKFNNRGPYQADHFLLPAKA